MIYWDGYRWTHEPGKGPVARAPRSRLRRIGDWILTVAAIIGILAVGLPFDAASAKSPSITVSPGSGMVGSQVTVSGAGFSSRVQVQLTWDGNPTGPVITTTTQGRFTVALTVPSASMGPHTLASMDVSSGGGGRPPKSSAARTLVVAATFTIVSAVAASPSTAATPVAAPTTAPQVSASPTAASTSPPATTPAPTAIATASNSPSPTPAPATAPPGVISSFVTRSGNHLLADGGTFKFRGLNVYDINGDGDCGYAIPDLGAELDAIGGSANVVRGWFFQYLATNHSTGLRDWTKMDATLATLRTHGVRVVVTLADQWGACEAALPRNQLTLSWYQTGYKTLPYNPDVSNSYRGWVAEIVTRYRNDPTILAWQLMNEATAVSDAAGSCPDQDTAASALQGWVADMAALVKGIDANHLLSVGTSGSSQCGTTGGRYQALHAINGVDICESHDYTSPTTSISDGVLFEIASCANIGKPIFVGEVGITGSQVGGSLTQRASLYANKFTAQMAAGMAGELVWAWRSTGDGGSSLTSYDIGPGDPTLGVLAGLPTH